MKVLHSICQQIWKTQQWPQDWKRSLFIPIPKKGNAKECSHYCTIALISHTSKVILKIVQARLQQYVNRELPDVQVDLEKAEEPEIKLSTSIGSSKKQEYLTQCYTCPLFTHISVGSQVGTHLKAKPDNFIGPAVHRSLRFLG